MLFAAYMLFFIKLVAFIIILTYIYNPNPVDDCSPVGDSFSSRDFYYKKRLLLQIKIFVTDHVHGP